MSAGDCAGSTRFHSAVTVKVASALPAAMMTGSNIVPTLQQMSRTTKSTAMEQSSTHCEAATSDNKTMKQRHADIHAECGAALQWPQRRTPSRERPRNDTA
jgi:hypothetical protein